MRCKSLGIACAKWERMTHERRPTSPEGGRCVSDGCCPRWGMRGHHAAHTLRVAYDFPGCHEHGGRSLQRGGRCASYTGLVCFPCLTT